MGIPAELVETQMGNHVYMANGGLQIGMENHPVMVRIAHRKGLLVLTVKSQSSMNISLPFDTPEQRKQALNTIKEEIRNLLN